jgi:hypothetical protein
VLLRTLPTPPARPPSAAVPPIACPTGFAWYGIVVDELPKFDVL